MKNTMRLLSLLIITLISSFYAAASEKTDVRLYRLDCGTMHIGDMSLMADNGDYKGRSIDIVISCYLIKHNNKWLLWDTGFPATYKEKKDGVKIGKLVMKLDKTIPEQLKMLNLTVNDIDFVALSHSHFDHAGQSNSFPNSTLFIQKKEYQAVTDKEEALKHFIDPQWLSYHLTHKNKLKLIDGDYDFFNDGTVKFIYLPGHTPGHMAMELNLKKNGPLIISGDQWHFEENRMRNEVPSFNYDHQQTIESSKKLESIIKRDHAELIIEHDINDNKKLPKLKNYLD
ncbi:N-acyl homoserine lactonase family protein [Gallaecimonas pentaromativorans]|uniref:N-acyl homoserine lactonase family protein n=1 Tax=Gallaecimonas pentaromativorans TaxID=584787 RepID=UPI003A8EFF1A